MGAIWEQIDSATTVLGAALIEVALANVQEGLVPEVAREMEVELREDQGHRPPVLRLAAQVEGPAATTCLPI